MSFWSSHLSEGPQGHSWCCHNASQYYEEISRTDPLWSPLTWGRLNAKFSWWLAGKHLKKASSIVLLPDPRPVGSPLPLSSLISCHGCNSLYKWHFSQHLAYHLPHPKDQCESPRRVREIVHRFIKASIMISTSPCICQLIWHLCLSLGTHGKTTMTKLN